MVRKLISNNLAIGLIYHEDFYQANMQTIYWFQLYKYDHFQLFKVVNRMKSKTEHCF